MAEPFDNTAEADLSFRCSDILSRGMYHRLFPKHLEISPQLNEVYELALAFYESQILTDDDIIQNGAYFVRVNKKYTRHFHMCTGDSVQLPNYSSSRLKSFFKSNQFRTGYATHGLFPYRGKFHPQMIKALMNIMGLKTGDTVLDPMMGSGTVPIEACLMGIKSIGFDASPFCRFMAQTKFKSLTLPRKYIQVALQNPDIIFDHFFNKMGHPVQKLKKNGVRQHSDEVIEAPLFQIDCFKQFSDISGSDQFDVYNFLLLAYLDSAGYFERSKNTVPIEQFRSILERYVFVVEKIQRVMECMEFEIGEATILEGDARFVN
ncbi:MAG: DNA methyltransferase, partial [Deltaproteobacteria bacterium]|nr:DNA methyltransferase [Deltaproteobacteria bacterium]